MRKFHLIKNIKAPVLLGLVCTFMSCNSFLEDGIDTILQEDNYFENQNKVERGIGAIYAEVGEIFGPHFGDPANGAFVAGPLYDIILLPGDDITTNNDNGRDFDGFYITSDNSHIWSYWSILYAIINRTNFMLEKLNDPAIQAVCTTPGYADWCKGECYFIRGWINMMLWNHFRKAPNQNMRIKSLGTSSLPPTVGFELLDQAITDLKQAEQLLPKSWDEKNKGRAFKNSARGMLVKCYTLRANYAKQYNGDSQEDYKNAISAFESMDETTTIVGVPFGDNFDYRTENNAESLFEYQASTNPQRGDNPWLDNNWGGVSGPMGVIYLEFYENYYTFSCVYGPTDKLISIFENADPRKAETVHIVSDQVDPQYSWLNPSDWGNTFNGWQFVKYINGARRGPLDPTFGVTSCNNPRILRFADVKLLAAEAYLETGDETSARKQVNDVRKRARLSTVDGTEAAVPADYTRTITMDDIMDERLKELAGEPFIRWMDLRRWHVAGFINLDEWAKAPVEKWGYSSTKSKLQFESATHLLFPIPYAEMTSNSLMMGTGNNPGYN